MKFSRVYIKVFIFTLIISVISMIYSSYLKDMQTQETQKTLFERNTERYSAQELINAEYEDIALKTVSKLLQAYNDKDMTIVKNLDYRIKKNNDVNLTTRYMETLSSCEKFRLHDVQVDAGSTYSISGFFTYSYLSKGTREKDRIYAATEFIIKKINDVYCITYLETKNFAPQYTEEEGIKMSLQRGKDTFGVENLLNLVFEKE